MTVRPHKEDRLISPPCVEASAKSGIFMPVKWSQAPSSTGSGKSVGNSDNDVIHNNSLRQTISFCAYLVFFAAQQIFDI